MEWNDMVRGEREGRETTVQGKNEAGSHLFWRQPTGITINLAGRLGILTGWMDAEYANAGTIDN